MKWKIWKIQIYWKRDITTLMRTVERMYEPKPTILYAGY